MAIDVLNAANTTDFPGRVGSPSVKKCFESRFGRLLAVEASVSEEGLTRKGPSFSAWASHRRPTEAASGFIDHCALEERAAEEVVVAHRFEHLRSGDEEVHAEPWPELYAGTAPPLRESLSRVEG
jgi:hypothetical protein